MLGGLLYWLLYFFADAAALYQQGITLFEKGQAAEAIPLLTQAAEGDPANAQYWKALGVAHASLSDYRGAAGPFQKACTLSERLLDACYYAGRALDAADRYRDALPLLRKDGAKARAGTAIAECHEALGEASEAERLFRSAIAKGAAPMAYGRFLVRSGRAAEGENVLAGQTDSDSLYWRALALSHLDRAAEALPLLEKSKHPAAAILRKRLATR